MADLKLELPVVRRARGYYLYDPAGRRYLDLWQNGGRSLLGHRSGRLTTVLKNTISKGLIGDLPSGYLPRLARALAGLFPGYRDFRLFSSPESACNFVSRYLGRSFSPEEASDPLFPRRGRRPGPVSLWRPLLAGQPAARVLLPVLPFALCRAPQAAVFRDPLPEALPPSEILSPIALAGLLACIGDLESYQPPQWFREDLLAGCPGWRQEGIYLVPDFDRGHYPGVFREFMAEGVILSPEAPFLSILPGGELSRGELSKMIGLFREFPGK